MAATARVRVRGPGARPAATASGRRPRRTCPARSRRSRPGRTGPAPQPGPARTTRSRPPRPPRAPRAPTPRGGRRGTDARRTRPGDRRGGAAAAFTAGGPGHGTLGDEAAGPGTHEAAGRPTGTDGTAAGADAPEATPSGTSEDAPAARPSRLSLRPLSQRRQTEAGALLRPGSAPRLRPRPAQDADSAEEAAGPTEQSASGDALFGSAEDGDAAAATPTGTPAPDRDVPAPAGADAAPAPDRPGAVPAQAGPPESGRNGSGSVGGGHTNGHGNGLPVRGRPGGEHVPRRPAAVLPNRERTPIFDEVASVWFREPEPNAPTGLDPEWNAADRPDFEAGAPSLAAVDAGTTEAGLPRRRPRAHLVPGSARPAPSSGRTGETGAAAPRRSAESIRGRLASYQRGVADGRSNRPAQPPDGGPAGGVPTRGPAHAAGPHTEEEEQ